MDSAKLSKQYIDEYNMLVNRYNSSGIIDTVNSINAAILSNDNSKTKEYYDIIQQWNSTVSDLESAREGLNHRFKHLHLPGVNMFIIAYDAINRSWKFNTDAE